MVAQAGIPTSYRQARFRSRLEARWASFFDLIGWKWTYEPLDADVYIPDFLIHGPRPFFVEVGPCILPDDFVQKATKPAAAIAELRHDVLIVGVNALADIPPGVDGPTAGWLGEAYWQVPDDGGGDYFDWDAGIWHVCRPCGVYAVHHATNSYMSRPCGHYDGDHHLGPADPYAIDRLWNHAGTVTQWKPRWR